VTRNWDMTGSVLKNCLSALRLNLDEKDTALRLAQERIRLLEGALLEKDRNLPSSTLPSPLDDTIATSCESPATRAERGLTISTELENRFRETLQSCTDVQERMLAELEEVLSGRIDLLERLSVISRGGEENSIVTATDISTVSIEASEGPMSSPKNNSSSAEDGDHCRGSVDVATSPLIQQHNTQSPAKSGKGRSARETDRNHISADAHVLSELTVKSALVDRLQSELHALQTDLTNARAKAQTVDVAVGDDFVADDFVAGSCSPRIAAERGKQQKAIADEVRSELGKIRSEREEAETELFDLLEKDLADKSAAVECLRSELDALRKELAIVSLPKKASSSNLMVEVAVGDDDFLVVLSPITPVKPRSSSSGSPLSSVERRRASAEAARLELNKIRFEKEEVESELEDANLLLCEQSSSSAIKEAESAAIIRMKQLRIDQLTEVIRELECRLKSTLEKATKHEADEFASQEKNVVLRQRLEEALQESSRAREMIAGLQKEKCVLEERVAHSRMRNEELERRILVLEGQVSAEHSTRENAEKQRQSLIAEIRAQTSSLLQIASPATSPRQQLSRTQSMPLSSYRIADPVLMRTLSQAVIDSPAKPLERRRVSFGGTTTHVLDSSPTATAAKPPAARRVSFGSTAPQSRRLSSSFPIDCKAAIMESPPQTRRSSLESASSSASSVNSLVSSPLSHSPSSRRLSAPPGIRPAICKSEFVTSSAVLSSKVPVESFESSKANNAPNIMKKKSRMSWPLVDQENTPPVPPVPRSGSRFLRAILGMVTGVVTAPLSTSTKPSALPDDNYREIVDDEVEGKGSERLDDEDFDSGLPVHRKLKRRRSSNPRRVHL